MTKIIHAYVYDPCVSSFFKVPANAQAELRTVTCVRSEDCGVFARGECIALRMFDRHCIHGHQTVTTGFTRRSQKFHSWIREAKASVEGVGSLKSPSDKVAQVGDHMWLPYPHMIQLKDLGWQGQLLPREQFTVENIIRLVEFLPASLFGGGIPSYQDKHVPDFVSHMAEEYPDLLQEAASKSERVREVVAATTKVGRKAILKTLLPSVGVFKDGWTWDGTYLITNSDEAALKASLFLPTKGTEVRLVPRDGAVMLVTDDGQVGPDTLFTD